MPAIISAAKTLQHKPGSISIPHLLSSCQTTKHRQCRQSSANQVPYPPRCQPEPEHNMQTDEFVETVKSSDPNPIFGTVSCFRCCWANQSTLALTSCVRAYTLMPSLLSVCTKICARWWPRLYVYVAIPQVLLQRWMSPHESLCCNIHMDTAVREHPDD